MGITGEKFYETMKKAIKLAEEKKERTSGLVEWNQIHRTLKDHARKLATELWNKDTEQKIRTGEMSNLVFDSVFTFAEQNGCADRVPPPPQVKKWIKDLRPEYAKKRGRPRK